jgi:hypothetical protein
VLQQVL